MIDRAQVQPGHRSRVEAIVFDLDDTLIVDDDALTSGLAATSAAAGGPNWEALFRAVWARAHSGWHQLEVGGLGQRLGIRPMEMLLTRYSGLPSGYRRLGELGLAHQLSVWRDALESATPESIDRAAELASTFQDEVRARYALRAGALETLASLARQYRLAVLTNGPGDLQREKIERLGLADVLDALVISGETGEPKPARGAFTRVLDLIGCRPEEAVMVGDHPEDDVAAARNAGLHAVLVGDDVTIAGLEALVSEFAR